MPNKTTKTFLLLNSLTVYRGILSRSVLKGCHKLLAAFSKSPEVFLSAYGGFYSLLCERSVSDRLAYTITEAALFDENAFTLAAAGNRLNELSDSVLRAVENDFRVINALCSLESDTILSEYGEAHPEVRDILDALPRYELGKPANEFSGELDLDSLSRFHRENGCGMFARYKAFIWRDGDIMPVVHPDKISLESFTGYEIQRNKVIDNTLAFLEGKSCNNCLLYGDMGTGKSSTVKAIGNEFRKKGLRIVEMPKERLMDFPLLVDKIAALPMKFIIFIDDLSFMRQDQSYTSLKAVLEGGLAARPSNALIYATSNRRHLIKESWQDRDADDIHRRDNMQETLSLSDRFGLAVCFGNPAKREYLEIVRALAKEAKIELDGEKLELEAEKFALNRGGRSPRCAKQFIDSLEK
ncbi:MAG: ATP-binding protein [Ruminococcus sp.]|nr:ATP-binding protein [Ruminococcus sp.]